MVAFYTSENDATLVTIKDDLSIEYKKNGDFTFSFERHDGLEIYVFLKGDANFFIEQGCFPMTRGDLYLIPKDTYHRVIAKDSENYERYVIFISLNYIKKLSSISTNFLEAFSNPKDGKAFFTHLSETELSSFLYEIKELQKYSDSNAFGADLMVNALFTKLLVNLHDRFQNYLPVSNSLTPSLVEEVMNYVQEHISENITIDDLSKALYRNRCYISRLFKDFTGITLQQYILSKKITLARQLLLEGHSITDVCYMSGFNNYANFIRSFTKHVGMSPLKYQKSRGEVF